MSEKIKSNPRKEDVSLEIGSQQKKGCVRKRLSRCRDWIIDQNNITRDSDVALSDDDNLYDNTDDNQLLTRIHKRKLPEEECFETARKLQRSLRRTTRNQKIILNCEWIQCIFTTENYVEFQNHIKKHISEVYIKTYESGENLYVCLWEVCGFETQNDKEIVRHINFHSYHTKVKAVGINVQRTFGFQKCALDTLQRNQLPELLNDYICQWVECDLKFTSIQAFIDHLHCHILGADNGGREVWTCNWLGCQSSFPSANNLRMHGRRHSGERVVGCIQCGGMFASNAVFEDHCTRQTEVIPEYKCETCHKTFSSERILRSHARRHINSYKCSFCDMSSPSPSDLIRHIRYRHLNYRPFNCKRCSYKAVSNSDLQTHLLRHEGILNTRSKNCDMKIFACHCCDQYYCSTGSILSKHLVTRHGFSRASFPRFRFEQGSDGFYKLLPIRIESLEVSNQIRAEQEEKKDLSLIAKSLLSEKDAQDFKIVKCSEGTNTKPASFIILPNLSDDKESLKEIIAMQEGFPNPDTISNDFNISPKKSAKLNKNRKKRKYNKKKNNTEKLSSSSRNCKGKLNEHSNIKSIEISISEIDDDGNIIKSEIVESQNVNL